ncbi:MAG: MBOAT family protein [Lachnospiraceae bacterium]|nr:MBOAT family protein [Lachnospiraceae bacterium]
MLFNSVQFAVFLPVVFMLYWALPQKGQVWLLLIASYYFYMSWKADYVILILFTTLVSFFGGLALERAASSRQKKFILSAVLIACLGVLFVFKYFNFLSRSLDRLCQWISLPLHPITLNLLLPVGISFYTFQTLSYVIDVYRGETAAEHSLVTYAAFVSFFPQLVAGPIERSRNLLGQIKKPHTFRYQEAADGIKLLAWGFFKKLVVADNLAVYVNQIYNALPNYRGLSLAVATVFFAFQIYCDFSGYSDIAAGTARLFGIRLMTNFRSPYFSSSFKEFWSRWHISLSTWFKDYVYIPLGGNRVGKFRCYLNLLLTFLISGLWHGASWTFIIWGGIHGGIQVMERFLGLGGKPNEKKRLRPFRMIVVFILVCLAWVFFRANSVSEAFYVFAHTLDGISNLRQYVVQALCDLNIRPGRACQLSLSLLILLVYDWYSLKGDVIAWIGRQKHWIRYSIYFILLTFVIFSRSVAKSDFIYFQF